MPALNTVLQAKLSAFKARGLHRALVECQAEHGAFVTKDGKKLLSFSGNDYLGLSQHPKVKEASQRALATYGAGAGASRLVSGNHPLYTQLEAKIASFKGTQAALVFGSGYMASIGIIPALVGRGDLVVADKLAHACMLDGIALSGARLMRFTHNNAAHAKEILEKHRAAHDNCLIITETIFSMDGDTAPLKELALLAHEHDAWLMTDDAHGLGIVKQEVVVDIGMGTLSKAAGSYGGYVACSHEVREYLINSARSFIFTTGLPPATVAASLAALEVMEKEPILAKRVLTNARLFTTSLGIREAESAIVPLVMGESEGALAASQLLEEAGYFVKAIRPPTVPDGTARLRFTFSALHEKKEILALAEFIKSKGWIHE